MSKRLNVSSNFFRRQ